MHRTQRHSTPLRQRRRLAPFLISFRCTIQKLFNVKILGLDPKRCSTSVNLKELRLNISPQQTMVHTKTHRIRAGALRPIPNPMSFCVYHSLLPRYMHFGALKPLKKCFTLWDPDPMSTRCLPSARRCSKWSPAGDVARWCTIADDRCDRTTIAVRSSINRGHRCCSPGWPLRCWPSS